MPPAQEGGPWPSEWILLFHRWVLEGCPTLELAAGDYRAERQGDHVTVVGRVPLLNSNEAVWFERYISGSAPADLVLYREPPEEPDGVPINLEVDDTIELPASATSVIILDQNGPQRVPILSHRPVDLPAEDTNSST